MQAAFDQSGARFSGAAFLLFQSVKQRTFQFVNFSHTYSNKRRTT